MTEPRFPCDAIPATSLMNRAFSVKRPEMIPGQRSPSYSRKPRKRVQTDHMQTDEPRRSGNPLPGRPPQPTLRSNERLHGADGGVHGMMRRCTITFGLPTQ